MDAVGKTLQWSDTVFRKGCLLVLIYSGVQAVSDVELEYNTENTDCTVLY